MKHAFFLATILLVFTSANAQRSSKVSGKTLLTACTLGDTKACDAYLDGFGDAILMEGKANALACIPASSSGTELRDVVVKYLRDHPEAQSQRASVIASRALGKAYPCNK